MRNFKKICAVKGGFSTEREISLISGTEMAKAARNLGYNVCEFDFTGDLPTLITFLKSENVDCILNGFHGAGGEDGNIQAVFNLLNIPYTHSGVMASSIAMDKYVSGLIFTQNGIRVPNNRLYIWDEFCKNPDFPLPFVIKPVNGGSSCGVYIINQLSDLNSIEWKYGKHVHVSEYIPGLELSIGVLDGKALEITNILTPSGFYDYTNKYTEGGSFHELPAKIPSNIRREAMDMAEKTYNILGCRGITRTDFRYNDVTNELFVLEINTQPGMSPLSLVPEQAKYVGITFEQLVDRLIKESCFDEF
ncbi:MAG: D-alanine--D-alanine ligase [Alphaproteobacteria bacterium]|nr:D-alanine--D-alanine ligase [Alphaproteobacteria bacterium]